MSVRILDVREVTKPIASPILMSAFSRLMELEWSMI